MKKCTICNSKITKNNNGISKETLNYSETQRFLKLKKEQTICLECKKDLLYAGIISPF
jgi:hypothetical protein